MTRLTVTLAALSLFIPGNVSVDDAVAADKAPVTVSSYSVSGSGGSLR